MIVINGCSADTLDFVFLNYLTYCVCRMCAMYELSIVMIFCFEERVLSDENHLRQISKIFLSNTSDDTP